MFLAFYKEDSVMKYYYALEQKNGNVSPFSNYGRPVLHIFYGKKERDDFVNNYVSSDLNHSASVTTSKIAYEAYSKVVDGVREFETHVVKHD